MGSQVEIRHYSLRSIGGIAATALLCLLNLAGCSKEEPAKPLKTLRATLTVQQPSTNIPSVRFYLDARDAQGNRIDDLTKDHVRAEVAGQNVPLDSLRPFRQSGEGVAYAMLVDVSGSVRTLLPAIKDAAREWTQQMGGKDVIALVKVGRETAAPTFVAPGPELIQTLEGLTATDDRTLLYDSLLRTMRAFDGSRSLPRRRAILVITDGEDDDDVSGTTFSDLSREIQLSGIPVYALGVTAVHAAPNADLAIKALAEIARSSHGAYRPLNGGSPSEISDAFHNQILDVYDAGILCNNCPHDGEQHSVQVFVRDTRSEVLQIPFNGSGAPWYKQKWLIWAVASVVVLLALAVWWAFTARRRAEIRRQRELADKADRERADQASSDRIRQLLDDQRRLQSELEGTTSRLDEVMRLPRETGRLPISPVTPPPAPRIVLSVINKPLLTKALDLTDRLTIGNSDSCDFRVADSRVRDCECEIRLVNGNPTLVNPDGSVRLKLQNVTEFKVGETKVRCVIG